LNKPIPLDLVLLRRIRLVFHSSPVLRKTDGLNCTASAKPAACCGVFNFWPGSKRQKHVSALNIAFATAVNARGLEANNHIQILNAHRFRKFNGLNTKTKAQAWFANLFKDRCQGHLKLSLTIPVDMRNFIPI